MTKDFNHYRNSFRPRWQDLEDDQKCKDMKRVRCYYHKPDPPNTRRCTRPGKFGNDFRIGHNLPQEHYEKYSAVDKARCRRGWLAPSDREAIRLFVDYQLPYMDVSGLMQFDNLACFCKSENPCHVDAIISKINLMRE